MATAGPIGKPDIGSQGSDAETWRIRIISFHWPTGKMEQLLIVARLVRCVDGMTGSVLGSEIAAIVLEEFGDLGREWRHSTLVSIEQPNYWVTL